MTIEIKADIIERAIDTLKEELEVYLRDKTVPLEQRWELFKRLPNYLSNHECWIQHFDALEDVSWYDEFGIDRHQTVKMKTLVEGIEENAEYREQEGYNPYDIEALKEDILERNIVSFVHDW